jgi:hypothetical protein
LAIIIGAWEKYGTQELRKRPAPNEIHPLSFEGVLLQEAMPQRSSFTQGVRQFDSFIS